MFPFTTNCQKNQIIYLRHSLFPYKAPLSYFLPDFAMYDGCSCFVFQYSYILHDEGLSALRKKTSWKRWKYVCTNSLVELKELRMAKFDKNRW